MLAIDMRLLAISAIYFVAQNSFFGWNMTPQSESELICDGITLVLLAMALRTGVRVRIAPTRPKTTAAQAPQDAGQEQRSRPTRD